MHEKTTSGVFVSKSMLDYVCIKCPCDTYVCMYVRVWFSSIHLPQIWASSPVSMSGPITDPAKIVVYEKRWHADIFVPCLKKLGTEVCVHELKCS